MTIDEQIAALNKLIAQEKMQLVRQEVKQVSEKYLRLVAERGVLGGFRETKGGAFETALSVSLASITTEASTLSIPIRAVSSDAVDPTEKSFRRANALSFLANAKKEASTVDDSQRACRSGSY